MSVGERGAASSFCCYVLDVCMVIADFYVCFSSMSSRHLAVNAFQVNRTVDEMSRQLFFRCVQKIGN